jgi:pimeloyl-ACP methyl ester carboxylesterase
MIAPVLVQTKFGPVECAQWGEGPAILAIHGGMGGYDQSVLLAKALAPNETSYRIIAVSRPGYLGTPLFVGGDPAAQADALAALLDELGVAAAAVVAVSAGGPSALQFAIRHPSRCRCLILVSACTGLLVTPDKVLSRMKLMGSLARIPGLTTVLRWRMSSKPDQATKRAIPDDVLRHATLADPQAGPLLRALQSSVFQRLTMRLPGTENDILRYRELGEVAYDRVRTPTLLVHGDLDDIVPPHHALTAHAEIAGSELLMIRGAGHFALFSHLAAVRKRSVPHLAAA